MELWNSRELCKAVNGKSLNNSFWKANSISIDTRSIKDGGVFFALKGNKVDGHKFINHAFENGIFPQELQLAKVGIEIKPSITDQFHS